MRYMKLYEYFITIEQACQKYNIDRYTLNQDNSIDVDEGVFLSGMHLDRLPLDFGKVNGYFDCSFNQLTNLKGSPKQVDGFFKCNSNSLTTLLDGPEKVTGAYFCDNNDLKDVRGFPENFHGLVFGSGNIVNGILSLVGTEKRTKFIKWLNEYDVIRDGNKIVEMRLEEAYWMACKEELPMDKRTFKNYQLI